MPYSISNRGSAIRSKMDARGWLEDNSLPNGSEYLSDD
jgi:hypothetical protein